MRQGTNKECCTSLNEINVAGFCFSKLAHTFVKNTTHCKNETVEHNVTAVSLSQQREAQGYAVSYVSKRKASLKRQDLSPTELPHDMCQKPEVSRQNN